MAYIPFREAMIVEVMQLTDTTGKKLKLILNKEIIAVNQDPTEQGILYKNVDNTQIWKKRLSNGDIALLMLNLDPLNDRRIEVDFTELGLSGKLRGRDLIKQKRIKPGKKVFSKVLEPHECLFQNRECIRNVLKRSI